VFVLRIRADVLAFALAVLVVVGVGAAVLTVGAKRPQRPAHHAIVGPKPPLVIRNFSPRRPPALRGRKVCAAQLTPPGVAPGGFFYMTVCHEPTVGRVSPRGTFQAIAAKVNGVSEDRFLITARGLAPNTAGSVYAVWWLQAAKTAAHAGGNTGTYQLRQPQRPHLLGLIKPGVTRDGKLAAEGSLPSGPLGDDILLLITLQPHPSTATPRRTVLRGFASLYPY
jgi:hypothetical protein